MDTAATSSQQPNRTFRDDADAALRAYHQLGYHVEPDLVSPEHCDALVARALALPNARDGTYRPIPMPHQQDPLFLEMMRSAAIVKIVEKLVGGRASGLGGEFFYMRPGTVGFTGHQDNYYVEAPIGAFCSAWTALCDVDAENGALMFYPGSHKLGLLPIRRLSDISDPGQNPGAHAIEAIVPDGLAAATICLRKGATAFFHGLLVHKSHDNTSSRFRYSFLATYIRKGEKFRTGTRQKRVEVDLHAF